MNQYVVSSWTANTLIVLIVGYSVHIYYYLFRDLISKENRKDFGKYIKSFLALICLILQLNVYGIMVGSIHYGHPYRTLLFALVLVGLFYLHNWLSHIKQSRWTMVFSGSSLVLSLALRFI